MVGRFGKGKCRWLGLAIALVATLGMGGPLVPAWGQRDEGVQTDEQLLQAMDEARFLSGDFLTETVDIRAERPDGIREATVQLLLKLMENEQYRLLIRFLAPEENVGQQFLILEDETVLLCTPDLEMPMNLTEATDVFGDSTVATTAGIQFHEKYEVADREETTLNEEPVLKVELRAGDVEATYPTASAWIDPGTFEPRQVLLFALSGDPLNRITYEEYAELDGDRYIKAQLIENLLQKGYKTRLTTTEISTESLPEELFDPETFCRPQEG